MKLRCIQIIDEKTGKLQEHSSWLTEGKVYHALGMFLDERKTLLIRMIGDDGITPALYGFNQFEVISPKIPSNWVVSWNDNVFQLAPARWLARGFWERYFNGESEALRIFDEERLTVEKEDP
jgi:hypothetical protein